MKRKVAVIGLGMAVKPHAQSWRDLADRAEVVAWYSRSAERRAKFTACLLYTSDAADE